MYWSQKYSSLTFLLFIYENNAFVDEMTYKKWHKKVEIYEKPHKLLMQPNVASLTINFYVVVFIES